MKQTYVDVELANGDVHTDIRITAPDRIAVERLGRHRNWRVGSPDSTHLTEQSMAQAWAALSRLGIIDSDWEGFRDRELVDISYKDAEAELAEENPSKREPSPGFSFPSQSVPE